MSKRKGRVSATEKYVLSSRLRLVVYGEEINGFAEMRLVDEDGDFMPVTMNELLNAISAGYHCQKDLKHR